MTTAAAKDLEDLPARERTRAIAAIYSLADNPRPTGASKMSGFSNAYRIRVGQYRIIYEIHGDVLLIIVTAIGHRREIYPLLKRRKKK